jgi:hypothetical protein
MDTPTFFLGAFVYPRHSRDPPEDARPVMATVTAPTPHEAKRLLELDFLRHDYFAKEIRLLTDYFSPFDEEDRLIS